MRSGIACKSVTVAFLMLTSLCFGQSQRTLIAPDSTQVTIFRDDFGVPHIRGESEVGVFFAQGFAVAEDRLFQLEIFRRAALGELGGMLGGRYVEMDKQTRVLFYTEQEREQQFSSLPAALQNMLMAYTKGINTYLDSMAANPNRYKPQEFIFMIMRPWKVTHSIAVMQFMMRNFGAFGGDELERLKELQEHGQGWFDRHRPINDPDAPTTIPGAGGVQRRLWQAPSIAVDPRVVTALTAQRQRWHQMARDLGLPTKFGSFAVLISPGKSDSDRTMLLGCPQMGTPRRNEPQIANEVELWCPELHAGGMTIAGIPGVIIGHNEHHAWTLTSGASDNQDIFIETLQDSSLSAYLYNGTWQPFQAFPDTVFEFGRPIPFVHYRSVHGPVVGEDLASRQAFALQMTFWDRELDMAVAMYEISRATTLEEVEAAAARIPMSFNLFYAGRNGTIKFWHVGRYQDRQDGVDPRLPHLGDGSQEWRGFLDFSQLPSAANPEQGYFVNWNNKPVSWWNNGDNVPWGADSAFTHRVEKIDQFVRSSSPFSFEHLKDVPRQINSQGTYQQAIAFSMEGIEDENILPPGQSGFISLAGEKSPHFDDQYDLYVNWQFKDMRFGEVQTTPVQSAPPQPRRLALLPNYPNPFNPQTTLSFELPQTSHVTLVVLDVRGRVVQQLVDGQMPAGRHTMTWHATHLPSGVYFISLRTQNGETRIQKALLVK